MVRSAEVNVKSLQGTGTFKALGHSLLIFFYTRTENYPQGEYSWERFQRKWTKVQVTQVFSLAPHSKHPSTNSQLKKVPLHFKSEKKNYKGTSIGSLKRYWKRKKEHSKGMGVGTYKIYTNKLHIRKSCLTDLWVNAIGTKIMENIIF